ncbi:MAG: thermonuclease family protein [Clostridia bacterium]|nr:thermonuclease family protein [Clostridia bacterium]
MRKKNILIIVLTLLVIVTGCSRQDSTNQQLVRVTRVVDGDTFVVSGGQKVRLIGIDTPEMVKSGRKTEPFGKEADAFARKLLEGQKVKLVFDVEKKDKYGRLLAYTYLEDGRFINEILVREGFAQVMTVPPNVAYAEDFVRWQQEARKAGKGLWGKSKNSN